jgi:hypothetical protein
VKLNENFKLSTFPYDAGDPAIIGGYNLDDNSINESISIKRPKQGVPIIKAIDKG